jgi:Outer membrane protein beta-barrel domain
MLTFTKSTLGYRISIPYFTHMRFSLFTLLTLLCCIRVEAQELKWDYGINADFNVALIKPAVSDSFTNKSGFGGGLFLEASKGNYGLQLSPSFAKTSYINDNSLATTQISSMDISIDFMYTANNETSVYFVGGITPAFSFAHTEKRLDGTKSSGLISKTVDGINPFDVAAKLGVSLKLNDGIRFKANYYDFLNGTQKNGKINGRVDYVQVGFQIRFNELNNGAKAEAKRIHQEAAYEAVQFHIKALTETSTLIFVLPPRQNGKLSERQKEQEEAIQLWTNSAIHLNYDAGKFAVIDNINLKIALDADSVNVYLADGSTKLQAMDSSFYVARIGEMFMDNNSKLSWGVTIYNAQMKALKYPFPSFITYRDIDSRFKNEASVVRMISELNSAIKVNP